MLLEAARRKCTNTRKMIRSFFVDRLRPGHPELSCSREEKTWDARPQRAEGSISTSVPSADRGFLRPRKKRSADPCPVMDVTVSAEG
jgi:hypothetical protein